MGVVVSGEDGNSGVSGEQRKTNLIAAENDFGLVMATLDQILVFFGSWWTTSLSGRVQVNHIIPSMFSRMKSRCANSEPLFGCSDFC